MAKAVKHKKVETIGILSSGGDAPGMNAAIRAVVRTALAIDRLLIIGVFDGFVFFGHFVFFCLFD